MSPDEGPATRIQQGAASPSWIAHEREAPGRPSWWFVGLALTFGAAVLVATVTLGSMRGEAVDVEALHAASETPFGHAINVLQLETTRAFAGIIAGATVVATAFAARRLAHSEIAGLVAGALIGLDPAVLLEGQLAVTAGFLRFAAASSLALALGGHRSWHWLAILPIAAGIAIDPRFITWGVAVAALLWLRGHIYSAPKHLGIAILQGIAIPVAIGALFHVVAQGIGSPRPVECQSGGLLSLLLREAPGYGIAAAIPNPVTWYAGGILLLGLAIATVARAASGFRLTRAPGRLQIRLDRPVGRLGGRAVWLLALAIAAPHPAALLPLGAIALGLATHHLLKDSLSFGGAVAGAMVAFAILYLVRLAALLDPAATTADVQEIMDFLPWLDIARCSG